MDNRVKEALAHVGANDLQKVANWFQARFSIGSWQALASAKALFQRADSPLVPILLAARASDTGRSEAEAELRLHWVDFCDADPTPDGFVERMEAAGLVELRKVNRHDLDDSFAAERGIYKGGSVWDLTDAGRTTIRALQPGDRRNG